MRESDPIVARGSMFHRGNVKVALRRLPDHNATLQHYRDGTMEETYT